MRSLNLSMSIIGGIFVLFVLNSTALLAQVEPEEFQVDKELIDIDVTSRPFSEIIDGIAEHTHQDIIYDEEEMEQVLVTIRLTRVPWRAALTRIAEEYKCVIEEDEYGIITITRPPVVTMDLDGADIKDVINYIAQVADENIVLSPNVTGKVSLRLKEVPWKDALHTITTNNGFVLIRAKGNIYRVVRPVDIKQQLETEIFSLRYIRPKSEYTANMSGSHFKRQRAKVEAKKTEFTLLTALKAVLSKGGQISYDNITNTLVITDSRPQLEKMKEIIRMLDREPRQVFIDVKFVRTTNTDIFDFGVDVGENGIRISQTFGSLSTRFPFTVGRGGFEDSIAAAPESVTEAPGTGLPTTYPSNPISFGVLDFSQTSFTLRLMKRDVRSKIIQAPKIVTLDHHEATIFVGRSVSFASSEIQQNDNGSSTVQLQEAPESPAQEGFQMLVAPHTLQDTNKLQLTIIVSNDQLTGSTSPTVNGFNRFETAGVAIDLPESTRQVLITHMILESGQTAVLGGLMTVNQTETVNKVPFFGDIPYVGYFFKNKVVRKDKQDLFIFLTPRIVQTSDITRENLETEVREDTERHSAEYSTIWQQNATKEE